MSYSDIVETLYDNFFVFRLFAVTVSREELSVSLNSNGAGLTSK